MYEKNAQGVKSSSSSSLALVLDSSRAEACIFSQLRLLASWTVAVLSKKNVFLFLKIFFLLRSTAATSPIEKKILFRFLEALLGNCLEHASERNLFLLACSRAMHI